MNQKTVLAMAFVSIVGSAAAQQTGFYSDGRPERLFKTVSGLDNRDMKFLKNAQASNKFEIESSELALTNSDSDFIKQFAKDMIADHGAAKDEIAEVATDKSFGLSTILPIPLQMKLNKLRGLHGAAFDNAYRTFQKAGHEQAVAQYKAEIERGHDQDVKAVAVKELPTIELHLKMLMAGKTETGAMAADHGL